MVCQIPTQVREDANNWRKKLKNVCINIFIIFKKIHDVQCTLYIVKCTTTNGRYNYII